MNSILTKSPAGSFLGTTSNSINFYYGISYAEPSGGKERWSLAKKKKEYKHRNIKGPSSFQTFFEKSMLFDPTHPEPGEDCLSLNIASPENAADLPVMIWIHGGAYLTGSANGAIYDMESLASKGVILVTINYRLGPFGFLKLDEVTNGIIPSTGNEGLLDQRLAIQWVKENIEAFGGNPENITIFGESAGSWSCALQVGMGINGDFQKAICQSGGADAVKTIEEANKWGELFISRCHDEGISIKDLLDIDPNKIINIARLMRHIELSDGSKWIMPEIGFAPVIDNHHLHEDYMNNFQNNDFGLMAGITLDEYRLWSAFHPFYKNLSKENLIKRLKKIFKEEYIDNIISLYSEYISKDNYGHLLSAVMTDITFGTPVEDILLLHKNAFAYIFTPQSPLIKGELGAFHSSELPYLFGVQNKPPYKKWSSDDRDAVASIMQEAWVNFAKTGNPSINNFEWKPFNKDENYALIGSSIKNIKSPFKERYRAVNDAKNF